MKRLQEWPQRRDDPIEQDLLDTYWQRYCTQQANTPHPFTEQQLCEIATVWLGSDFVANSCISHPSYLITLLNNGYCHCPIEDTYYDQQLKELLTPDLDEHNLKKQLRIFRTQAMLRIIWRDLCELATLEETIHDLSTLADACINHTLKQISPWFEQRYGIPRDQLGAPMPLMVVALGKLGSKALNISSDIDLLFSFKSHGQVQAHGKHISHQEYFTKLGQKFIEILDSHTVDGFVFRIDMRLRPYGSNGQLAYSLGALETYYQEQGRDWERYALIKARLVNKPLPPGGKTLISLMRNFVYRRYVDYGVIDALRQLKQLMQREIRAKHLQNNIKRGPGGIREVEFVAQAFQLIRGGLDHTLQERQCLKVLNLLTHEQHLSNTVVNELVNAYRFLRSTEHHLQAFADCQTQELPSDPIEQHRLARSMKFDDWNQYYKALAQHRKKVDYHFMQMINTSVEHEVPIEKNRTLNNYVNIWLEKLNEQAACRFLIAQGFAEPKQSLYLIYSIKNSPKTRHLSGTGRNRLRKIMPFILRACDRVNNPDQCLARIAPILEATMRRSAYLALLYENKPAIDFLISLCSASAWIADYIARFPLVIDELLDQRMLEPTQDQPEIDRHVQHLLLSIPNEDIEQQMDLLRRFKHGQLLRIASLQIKKLYDPIEIGYELSKIADIILSHVLNCAWYTLTQKYGYPSSESPNIPGFAIIAYGKLGSYELNYLSDLDLVFIHQNIDGTQYTNGDNAITHREFYAHFAKRIINMIDMRTSAGTLYQVDTRLRPSGESGLIVSSMQGFSDYQNQTAWTFEHQAIIKARFICGDPTLKKLFEETRYNVLTREKCETELRTQIIGMREKMRQQNPKLKPGYFHLKYSPGGLVDIEFIVQYLVLRFTPQHPKLCNTTNNLKLLNYCQQHKLLEEHHLTILNSALTELLECMQHLALDKQHPIIEQTPDICKKVCTVWHDIMISNSAAE